MAIWRCLCVLLLLTSANAAAKADDLAKLKASLTERFAAYGTLSLEYTTSGPDPVDYSKTIGSKCLWERMDGRERIEGAHIPELAKSVWTFDGNRTTLVNHPSFHEESSQGGQPLSRGYARIHRGAFATTESQSNIAAWILGLSTNETRTSFLEIVSRPNTKSLLPQQFNGRLCPVWEVSGKLPDGGSYVGRLVVDVEAGWLPVSWETESTISDQRDVMISQTVTGTLEVVNERTGEEITVPRTGKIVFRVGEDPEDPPQLIEFSKIAIGHQIPIERFQATIPDGYEVRDETSNSKHPKEYINGGTSAEKQRLAEIATESQVMQAIQMTATVNASIPKGPSWFLWVFCGSIILAIGSLYVRRW